MKLSDRLKLLINRKVRIATIDGDDHTDCVLQEVTDDHVVANTSGDFKLIIPFHAISLVSVLKPTTHED